LAFNSLFKIKVKQNLNHPFFQKLTCSIFLKFRSFANYQF